MENKNFILFIFLINFISLIRLSATNNAPYGYIIKTFANLKKIL